MTHNTTNKDNQSIHQYAKQALALMAKYGIPPTPNNYAVWYTHTTNESTSLSERITQHIKVGQPFDTPVNQALYEQHTNHIEQTQNQNKAMHDTQDVLTDALEVITSIITEADSHNDTIQTRLDDIIDHKEDTQNVTNVIEALVAAAKEMKKSSLHMRNNLDESRKEVEGLKQNLAKVSEEADHDFLTGVYNRKALDANLDELLKQAAMTGQDLCFVMIDIDHFKDFNDSYGHLIGDEVLKMVAKILNKSLKGKDIVARFGGEEFAIVLPSTPIGNAVSVADNIRRSIANKELMHRSSGTSFGSVTVSMGVASYQYPDDTLESLIERADTALYRSKRGGRNRVTQETVTGQPEDPKETITF